MIYLFQFFLVQCTRERRETREREEKQEREEREEIQERQERQETLIYFSDCDKINKKSHNQYFSFF